MKKLNISGFLNAFHVLGGGVFAPIFMTFAIGDSSKKYDLFDGIKFFLIVNLVIILGAAPFIKWERDNVNSEPGGLFSLSGGFIAKTHAFCLFAAGFFIGSIISLPFMGFDPMLLWIPGSIFSGCLILILFFRR